LIQLEFIMNRINEVLYSLEFDIVEKINLIGKCKSFEDSVIYFDYIRSKLSFIYRCRMKYKIELSDRLSKIIDDFERTDVFYTKKMLWEKISSGLYEL